MQYKYRSYNNLNMLNPIKLKNIPREADPFLRRLIGPLAAWIVLLAGILAACWWPGISHSTASLVITAATVAAVGIFGWSYVRKYRHQDDADGRVISDFNIGIACAVVAWTGLRFLFIRMGGEPHTVDQLQGIAVGVCLGLFICFTVFVGRRIWKK